MHALPPDEALSDFARLQRSAQIQHVTIDVLSCMQSSRVLRSDALVPSTQKIGLRVQRQSLRRNSKKGLVKLLDLL
jgi:hypothetical protein